MVCQKVSHILLEKRRILLALGGDTFPAKCDALPAKYVTPFGKPLALRILNNLKLSHYQTRFEQKLKTRLKSVLVLVSESL